MRCYRVNLSHSMYTDAYRKVLTRNAYSSPEKTERSDTKTVHTKADILNLISSDTTALARVGWTFISLFKACIELFLGMSYVWLLLGGPIIPSLANQS